MQNAFVTMCIWRRAIIDIQGTWQVSSGLTFSSGPPMISQMLMQKTWRGFENSPCSCCTASSLRLWATSAFAI